uniref:Uncharacterized protein n=1 Tax=Anguilla anguilla TaxID=7936 RepID=A0A0E9VP79_ANGAN
MSIKCSNLNIGFHYTQIPQHSSVKLSTVIQITESYLFGRMNNPQNTEKQA